MSRYGKLVHQLVVKLEVKADRIALSSKLLRVFRIVLGVDSVADINAIGLKIHDRTVRNGGIRAANHNLCVVALRHLRRNSR